jgi:hypothetical protein
LNLLWCNALIYISFYKYSLTGLVCRCVSDAKTSFISIRCTAKDRSRIDETAMQSGLSMGAYLRALALGSPGPRAVRRPPVERKELARLLGQLGKVGSNLNQLAHAFN